MKANRGLTDFSWNNPLYSNSEYESLTEPVCSRNVQWLPEWMVKMELEMKMEENFSKFATEPWNWSLAVPYIAGQKGMKHEETKRGRKYDHATNSCFPERPSTKFALHCSVSLKKAKLSSARTKQKCKTPMNWHRMNLSGFKYALVTHSERDPEVSAENTAEIRVWQKISVTQWSEIGK